MNLRAKERQLKLGEVVAEGREGGREGEGVDSMILRRVLVSYGCPLHESTYLHE